MLDAQPLSAAGQWPRAETKQEHHGVECRGETRFTALIRLCLPPPRRPKADSEICPMNCDAASSGERI
jgi:hypothetical protein